jgi:hypothetical protein
MKLLFNNLAVLLSEAELPQPNPADDYVDLRTVTLGQKLAEELSCLFGLHECCRNSVQGSSGDIPANIVSC